MNLSSDDNNQTAGSDQQRQSIRSGLRSSAAKSDLSILLRRFVSSDLGVKVLLRVVDGLLSASTGLSPLLGSKDRLAVPDPEQLSSSLAGTACLETVLRTPPLDSKSETELGSNRRPDVPEPERVAPSVSASACLQVDLTTPLPKLGSKANMLAEAVGWRMSCICQIQCPTV